MILGCLRVKNESRWIGRCIASMLPVCERILVLDDHSDDGTPFLCASYPRVEVFDSPFAGINEARDKNYLLAKAAGHKPDWLLWLDGDEALADDAAELIRGAVTHPPYRRCFHMPVWFLWGDEEHIRTDGVYGRFRRDSLFRPGAARFVANGNGGSFHCGNAPAATRAGSHALNAPILHYGYMRVEDRVRKYEWYNRIDPKNAVEDEYRHVVIGDVFPAESRFKHGGPLQVTAI